MERLDAHELARRSDAIPPESLEHKGSLDTILANGTSTNCPTLPRSRPPGSGPYGHCHEEELCQGWRQDGSRIARLGQGRRLKQEKIVGTQFAVCDAAHNVSILQSAAADLGSIEHPSKNDALVLAARILPGEASW